MIVIGDVHGCYDLLTKLIDKLPKNSGLCFVGDLIDRGPDSKKVVDFVKDDGHACVMGNHEQLLVNAMNHREEVNLWLSNGGGTTIKSFGDTETIREYLPWFKSLPLICTYKDWLISHSYATHGMDTDQDTLLWGRVFTKPYSDFKSVFGHTPHNKVSHHHKTHWCVDTGAHCSGVLSAMNLDTMEIYSVEKERQMYDIDRTVNDDF